MHFFSSTCVAQTMCPITLRNHAKTVLDTIPGVPLTKASLAEQTLALGIVLYARETLSRGHRALAQAVVLALCSDTLQIPQATRRVRTADES